jgi:1-acyl-sn-glycerol-3-phosphate acyltransferase
VENHDALFKRPEDHGSIRFLMAINRWFVHGYHHLRVHTPCPLPKVGPAILVSNHTSSLDPLIIQATTGRVIRWMMAGEYYDMKPMNLVFETIGVILVRRSGRDLAATRAAMRALESGSLLGVFPEGKIETNSDLLPFQSGIGLLALKTGAPVYPVFIDGTQRRREMLEAFVVSNDISVAFGPQMDFTGLVDRRHDIEVAAQRIRTAVRELRDQFHTP